MSKGEWVLVIEWSVLTTSDPMVYTLLVQTWLGAGRLVS